MFPLDPALTHSRCTFVIVTTMRGVPDKAGHEMTVGARQRFSALDCIFLTKKLLLVVISSPYWRFRSRDLSVTLGDPSDPCLGWQHGERRSKRYVQDVDVSVYPGPRPEQNSAMRRLFPWLSHAWSLTSNTIGFKVSLGSVSQRIDGHWSLGNPTQ
jgi:hypothetical protein